MRLYSRPGNDISKRFSAIAEAVADLPRRSLVLDGELVAFNEADRPDFHLLRSKRPYVVAWFFDLLSIDGTSLRRQPWFERRRRLERVMARHTNPLLQLNDLWEDGELLLRACDEQGLEGIVSKLRSAPYISGPTDAWVKVKVAGWTESNRSRFKRR